MAKRKSNKFCVQCRGCDWDEETGPAEAEWLVKGKTYEGRPYRGLLCDSHITILTDDGYELVDWWEWTPISEKAKDDLLDFTMGQDLASGKAQDRAEHWHKVWAARKTLYYWHEGHDDETVKAETGFTVAELRERSLASCERKYQAQDYWTACKAMSRTWTVERS